MYKTIWNDTLELIRKTNQFDANTFRFFETDTYIYNIENNTATIIAPQILTQQILLKNHPLITEQLSIVLQKPMETHILLQNEVTPISLEDVILEIKSRQAIAKNKKLSYNTY